MSFRFSFTTTDAKRAKTLNDSRPETAQDNAFSGLARLAAQDAANDAADEARIERAAIVQFDGALSRDDADIAAGIGPYTDAEEKLRSRRRHRAQVLGLDLDRAERLADRLVHRDRDADDRIACPECRHARVNSCAKRDAYLPDILQRCPRFHREVDL